MSINDARRFMLRYSIYFELMKSRAQLFKLQIVAYDAFRDVQMQVQPRRAKHKLQCMHRLAVQSVHAYVGQKVHVVQKSRVFGLLRVVIRVVLSWFMVVLRGSFLGHV